MQMLNSNINQKLKLEALVQELVDDQLITETQKKQLLTRLMVIKQTSQPQL